MIILSAYTYTISYKPIKEHENADCLSISNYVVYILDMLNLFLKYPNKGLIFKATYILDPLLCLGVYIKLHNMVAYFCYVCHVVNCIILFACNTDSWTLWRFGVIILNVCLCVH